MKILALFFFVLIFSSITICITTLKSTKKEHLSIQTQSEETKNASGQEHILHAIAGFRSPKIVQHLREKDNAPKVAVDEISTGNVFYDGSENLAVAHVNCDVFSTNPPVCVKNEKCGWCGDRSVCIAGTSRGPLAPCLKNTFIYSTNVDKWNPLKAGTINIDHGGAIQNVPSPDLKLIYTHKPYN